MSQPPALPGRWEQGRRDWAVALWVAFLAACAGMFVLFALIDPERLGQAWVMGWETGLRLTYGLGFVFVFGVSLLATRLAIFMVRTGPARGHAVGKGKRAAPEIIDPEELNPDLKDETWK